MCITFFLLCVSCSCFTVSFWYFFRFVFLLLPFVSGWHLSEGSFVDPNSSGGSLVTGQRWHSSSSYHILRLPADSEQALPKGTNGQVLCLCVYVCDYMYKHQCLYRLMPLPFQHIFKYLQAEAVKKEKQEFLTGWKGFFKMVRRFSVVISC